MTQPTPPEEQEKEANSLLPALAVVLAAYAAYGATKGTVTGSWQQIAETLKLPATIGGALYGVADRALARQRSASPARRAEALLNQADPAREAGHDAGMQTLVKAAKSVVRSVHDNPPEPGETPEYLDPQRLHNLVAHAVISSAQMAAAKGIGLTRKRWHNVGDSRVRTSHAILGSRNYPGSTVPISDNFVTPEGVELRFPGDPTAPLDEVIGCRCWLTFHP
jgi:hypothetical protein